MVTQLIFSAEFDADHFPIETFFSDFGQVGVCGTAGFLGEALLADTGCFLLNRTPFLVSVNTA